MSKNNDVAKANADLEHAYQYAPSYTQRSLETILRFDQRKLDKIDDYKLPEKMHAWLSDFVREQEAKLTSRSLCRGIGIKLRFL